MMAFLHDVMITFIMAGVIFFGLQASVQSSVVIGPSMEPSFQNGQRILVNKLVYKLKDPQRGDVIVFHPPNGQKTEYIKRVIGLPGETVEVVKGKVYIYQDDEGVPLDEPYIKATPNYTLEKYKISPSSYFVLGDNRNNSDDSHNEWVVPRANIVGEAWLSIWPPGHLGLVNDYSLEKQVASYASTGS